MKANEKQVGGEHYKADVQHWDMVVMHDLNYFEGQITKYVMRARKKNGLQDLEKAKHFIEKYMEVWHEVHRLPPAVVHVLQRTQDQIDSEFAEQQHACSLFQPDGFSGDGTNGYQCVKCRKVVRANSPLGAYLAHGRGVCPPLPAQSVQQPADVPQPYTGMPTQQAVK